MHKMMAPLVVVGEDSEITRLGKAVDRDHRLAGESIERTLGALGQFKDLLNELKVERVGAVGTSVLRDAQNGKDFLELARTQFGLDIEIISGDRGSPARLQGCGRRSRSEYRS